MCPALCCCSLLYPTHVNGCKEMTVGFFPIVSCWHYDAIIMESGWMERRGGRLQVTDSVWEHSLEIYSPDSRHLAEGTEVARLRRRFCHVLQ